MATGRTRGRGVLEGVTPRPQGEPAHRDLPVGTSARLDATDVHGLAARAFLRSEGLSAEAVRSRPIVGIANSWSELNPCNAGLRDLATAVKRGVVAAGGLPLEFPTISLAEPFVAPTTMLLRNLMSIDVEEMIRANPIDAVVLLGGCDKTTPAQLMGAASAGKPAIQLGAGYRATSSFEGQPLVIDQLWELGDRRRAGDLDDDAWLELEGCLNITAGHCNVMGTASTMAVISEVLGMALPGSAAIPAAHAQRVAAAEATGRRAVELARTGTTPADHITPAALDNAVRAVLCLGGSTNAVIHLEAIAGRLGLRIGLDRWAELSRATPVLGDLRPSGPHLLEELYAAGGVPALLHELDALGMLDTSARAGSGETWAEVLARTAAPSNRSIRPHREPVAEEGGIAILRGSLAPRGAVFKRAAATPELWRHTGPAVVFEGVDDLHARIDDPALGITAAHVLVLRHAGPKGAPGMPEAGHLPIPVHLLRQGVRDMVRLSDARMSGTASGAVALHVAPEAAEGGPLALVRDGDLIALDAIEGRLDLLVDEAELARRRSLWVAPSGGPRRGWGWLHHRHVLQADEGCDFDFLRA